MIIDIINRIATVEVRVGPRGQDGAQGEDGASVNLRKTSTHIQWQTVGATTWTNLVALPEITGAPGPPGDEATPITSVTDDGSGNLTFHTATASYGPFALRGPQGEQGEQGEQGQQGNDGFSAYDVAVANGFSGTQPDWLQSLVGGPGPQGEPGIGIPSDGGAGQVLVKTSATPYDAAWTTLGTASLLNVGTTVGTVAAGNDARFTDSREWTAATVDQAEAEAGTATTRRAWTAQRVRQAIVAWWGTITAAALRTKAELGDSATRNVGTTAGTVAAGDDSRLSDSRTPTAHASSHVAGGADEIRAATASQNGLMTATHATKLDGIEAGADVTDAANVGAAISGAATETTLADTDELAFVTSGSALKNIAYSAFKTLLDAIYAIRGAVTGSGLTMATARLLGRSTASTGAVEEISIGSGLSLAAGVLSATGGGGGKILQVIQATKTDTASVTGTTFGGVMQASITPTSATSKVLVLSYLSLSGASLNACFVRLTRSSSVLVQGDAEGSRTRVSTVMYTNIPSQMQSTGLNYMDSPASITEQTYVIEIASSGTGAVFLNRSATDTNSGAFARAASTIILMEVAE